MDAKVLLIEANKIGGDCTWTGCVPSKALLYCASVIKEFTAGQERGWVSGEFEVDFSAIQTYVRNVINTIAASAVFVFPIAMSKYTEYITTI